MTGGCLACGEAQNPLCLDRMTQKMTSVVGNALPYAMTYDMITGQFTPVRWTFPDEPKTSGLCSHWCTMFEVNPMFYAKHSFFSR